MSDDHPLSPAPGTRDRYARDAAAGHPEARRRLLALAEDEPLASVLVSPGGRPAALAARLAVWPEVLDAVTRAGSRMRPFDVWSVALPLAQAVLARGAQVVGLAAPAGCGKTTLADAVITSLSLLAPAARALTVSLDDFYLSRAERRARGVRFRAQPGSHDLDAALHVIAHVREGDRAFEVPRFDHAADDVAPSRQVAGPVGHLLLEGWLVGLRTEGYEPLAREIDWLVYLDCPDTLARDRRFEREAGLRAASDGARGFSESEMDAFWSEVLGPGITRWLPAIRQDADLVIGLDAAGRLTGAHVRSSSGAVAP